MGFLKLRRALKSASLLFLLSAVTWGAGPPVDDADISLEHQVKAAFVFNFARFVTWPAGTFASTESPLTIGLIGQSAFASALQKTLDGKTVEGRTLSVRQVDNANGVQIIIISPLRANRVSDILGSLAGKPVLTVSESNSFLKQGGMIRLSVNEDKVRFSINQSAVDMAGLSISSQMLQYASDDKNQ